MTLPEWQQLNDQLITEAVNFIKTLKPALIHTFLPHTGNKEPDTLLLTELLKKEIPKVQFVFPRIIPGTRQMQHFLHTPDTLFENNQWGISEPVPATSVEIDAGLPDLILLPMLIFDRKGYRVGYGGGFYDRFLATCRNDAVKAGLCFYQPVETITDAESYDIPLDFCITPDNIWKW